MLWLYSRGAQIDSSPPKFVYELIALLNLLPHLQCHAMQYSENNEALNWRSKGHKSRIAEH